MARIASIAIGGYYPTPTHLTQAIADLVRRSDGTHRDAWLDPCAGKGEAIASIITELYREEANEAYHASQRVIRNVRVYTIELEKTRHEACRTTISGLNEHSEWGDVDHGDALRAEIAREPDNGVSVLYLNPPYDLDPRFQRLEERFLQRLHDALMPGGVLLFVIPVYAIAASVHTLATAFEDVDVVRFPDADYAAYQQVVVRGVRRATTITAPDQRIVGVLTEAMANPMALPVLGDRVPQLLIPVPPPIKYSYKDTTEPGHARISVTIKPVDVASVRELHRPWHFSDRLGRPTPMGEVFPKGGSIATLARRFPAVVPPKPAHIAAGIAAGLFNGAEISPNAGFATLPNLLVKGVFAREWRTVEVKTNQKGETTGEVQVEEPKLKVTVLNLSNSLYSTLSPSPEPTGVTDPATMTTGDLLTSYGLSLMGALRDHCPVMYDPQNPDQQFPVLQPGRPLYKAQAHTSRAIVMRLGGPGIAMAKRHGKYALLIGELGSGKSGVFLTSAATMGAKVSLVMCPPHLLQSWVNEVAVVWPGAKAVVLDSIEAVDTLAKTRASGDTTPYVGILSRETAKLGCAWEGVTQCPKCGTKGLNARDNAEKRQRCQGSIPMLLTPEVRLGVDLAVMLRGFPEYPAAIAAMPGRGTFKDKGAALRAVYTRLYAAVASGAQYAVTPLCQAAFTLTDADRVAVATLLLGKAADDVVAQLLAATHPDTPGMAAVLEVLHATGNEWSKGHEAQAVERVHTAVFGANAGLGHDPYSHLRVKRERAAYVPENDEEESDGDEESYTHPAIPSPLGAILVNGIPLGSPRVLDAAIAAMCEGIQRKPCGEYLYQATPTPRRYPLATYIARRYPNLFDVLAIDESQEAGGNGSAQSKAAFRLAALGHPVVLLTGSVMNGYAEHLFNFLWALDPKFRVAFPRNGRGAFVKMYGYRRRFISEGDTSKTPKRFGSRTDREETTTNDMGSAPGVQPQAVLTWLFPVAVTLHKADLQIDIPPCTVERVLIDADADVLAEHKRMLQALVTQIRRDAFTPRTGALWGQLSEAPSQLDRATNDTGNSPEGDWVVKYPEARGGEVVTTVPGASRDRVLAKERWMIDTVTSELALGRPCMVLVWHLDLMPRYARLLKDVPGAKVAILYADKVAPAKRQAWIEKQLASGANVLITNPVCIQTGLNCLTEFATQLWMQNPNCNAIVARQAGGRIDRIGQKRPSRILWPVYRGTAQEALHKLLLQKVAVSQATDGMDARSALQAAGVGDSAALSSLSVGKILFDMLEGGGNTWEG